MALGQVRSDVDLVVDRPIARVVATAAASWRERGLWPVAAWPYDVGGTGSVFLATEDAAGGVQLDLLHDLQGRGRYGARSGRLLEGSVPGQAFPTVAPLPTTAYLVVKRHLKGMTEVAAELAGGVDAGELREAADDALVADRAALVRSFLDGVVPPVPARPPSVTRLVGRMLHPVGAWLSVAEAEHGRSLVERFGRFLPHARLVRVDSRWDWVRSVVPVRWRPGIVISPPRAGWPAPDVVLAAAGDVDTVGRQAVEALSRRVLARQTTGTSSE